MFTGISILQSDDWCDRMVEESWSDSYTQNCHNLWHHLRGAQGCGHQQMEVNYYADARNLRNGWLSHQAGQGLEHIPSRGAQGCGHQQMEVNYYADARNLRNGWLSHQAGQGLEHIPSPVLK